MGLFLPCVRPAQVHHQQRSLIPPKFSPTATRQRVAVFVFLGKNGASCLVLRATVLRLMVISTKIMIACNNPECGRSNQDSHSHCAFCGRALPRLDGLEEEVKTPELDLHIEPFRGTPEEIERQWFEQVY